MSAEHQEFYESFDPSLGAAVHQIRAMVADGSLHDLILGELETCGARYQDQTPLAEGGMKSILRACDMATGRDVAMAIIPADSSDSVIESFLREARITALLQHPNIMPVYDIGIDDDGRPFFTMKLVDGDSLDAILRLLRDQAIGSVEQYSPAQLIDIFQKLCESVAYAHSRGVIHLDIKPANVQISAFGEVMLLDWGLARVMDEHCEDAEIARYSLDMHAIETLSARGFIKGTPGYMAPEQTSADEKGKHTDIYALGAVLYCILTYEAPIDAGDINSIVRKTRDGSIVPPIARCPERGIPSGLNAICMKALSSDPIDRYADAADLLADLANWRGGYATEAEGAGFVTHARLLIARHRGIVATAAVAILLLVGLASSFVFRVSQANQEAQSALAALHAEEAQRKDLAERNAAHRMEAAEQAFSEFRHSDALHDAQSVIDLIPGHPQAHSLLGKLQIIRGEFALASDTLSDDSTPLGVIAEFAKQVVSSKDIAERMPELLRHLNTEPELATHCLASWPTMLQIPPQRRYALAQRLLIHDNPGLTVDQFNYDSQSRRFSLFNEPRLRRAGALAWLDLRHLDLRNTSVSDLSFLRSRQLLTLKLAGCPIVDLSPLHGNSIEVLDIARTLVEDFAPISGLPLSRLDISGLAIRDPRPLVEHRSLREVVAYEYQMQGPRRRRVAETLQLIELPSPPIANISQRRRRQIRVFDRNRDGSLQLPEFPWPFGLFATLDVSQDDTISEAELRLLGLPLAEPPRSGKTISLGSFSMSDCEITNHEFAAFVNDGLTDKRLRVIPGSPAQILDLTDRPLLQLKACTPDDPLGGCGLIMRNGRAVVPPGYENLPVVHVTWDGATAYSAHVKGRLPTREEWLIATDNKRLPTADGTVAPHLANIEFGMTAVARGIGHLVCVGCYPANRKGLHDLMGSVREWTATKGKTIGVDFTAHPQEAGTLIQNVSEADSRTGFRVVYNHPK
ncbi:MAG: sulfatase activating formylglycine-generating enzyme [Rhodothermales bacterium]|jgi:formylglycine-generating enzyme required for sulfatase activity